MVHFITNYVQPWAAAGNTHSLVLILRGLLITPPEGTYLAFCPSNSYSSSRTSFGHIAFQ